MDNVPHIFEHIINEDLLDGTNELMVCLAQTPPPSKENIRNGNASEILLPFLQSFFNGNPEEGIISKLNELVPDQSKLVLVLIPEFAISMANWTSLDAMIRQLQRRVIVIGGIGVVPSSSLKKWKHDLEVETDTTERIYGFSPDVVSGADIISYNVGSCWIHIPSNRTQNILFLKNYLERTSETLIDGLNQGSQLLCLKADDLYIYPLICAEFTSQQISAKPLFRIKEHIEHCTSQTGVKNILITGVSYEPDSSHHLWRQGINESVHLGPNIITVIVNNALDPCYSDDNKDKWRCLTGVFAARVDAREQTAPPPARALTGDHDVVGVLCRSGNPQIICGEISWDLSRAGTRFVWRPLYRALASTDGILQEVKSGNIYLDELKRFIRRYSPAIDCRACSCQIFNSCRFYSGGYFTDDISGKCTEKIIINKWLNMKIVETHIETEVFPDAKKFFSSIHSGLISKDINPDKMNTHEVRFLERGLQAIGALKRRTSSLWAIDSSYVGQVVDEVKHCQILVWVDPSRRGRDIELAIDKWSQDSLSGLPLLAIVHGFSGACKEGLVTTNKSLRRSDIGAAPMPDDRKGIEAHRLKKATIMELGRIENCIDNDDSVSSIDALLQAPLLELTNV